jgi:hypothetical protein
MKFPCGEFVRLAAAGLVVFSCAAFLLAIESPRRLIGNPMAASLRCHPWGKGVKAQMQPGRCVPQAPKIVLWGDSYTGAWEPFALSLANKQQMAAVSFVEPGCPAVIGFPVPHQTARASKFCVDKSTETLAYLEANGADTLIVASHWARLLREQPAAGAGMLAWAKALPKVRRLLVVGATPEVRDSVEHCIEIGESCDISRADFNASSEPTRRVMREMAKLPNVEVILIGDWLCDAKTCPGIRDGKSLYFKDNHHVAASAVGLYVAQHFH